MSKCIYSERNRCAFLEKRGIPCVVPGCRETAAGAGELTDRTEQPGRVALGQRRAEGDQQRLPPGTSTRARCGLPWPSGQARASRPGAAYRGHFSSGRDTGGSQRGDVSVLLFLT